MNISPIIQSRVRQLLGLTGGVEVEAIEAVQPVAIIAGAADTRQPQNESGDQLVRRFYGQHNQGAGGAGTYAHVGLRTTQPDTLLWLQRVGIMNTSGGALSFTLGRIPNYAALTYGAVGFTDCRLPNINLGATLAEVVAATPVFPTAYAQLVSAVAANSSVVIPVDVILIANLQTFAVICNQANQPINGAWFDGIAFTRVPPL